MINRITYRIIYIDQKFVLKKKQHNSLGVGTVPVSKEKYGKHKLWVS